VSDRKVEDIDDLFRTVVPADKQVRAMERVRQGGVTLVLAICEQCPSCPDRDLAVNLVRAAVHFANAAICRG
jgi:hypothetical protein